MAKKKVLGRKSKIFIDNDLTVKERQIQKLLWNIVKKEREKGKRATIGYQKIWLDNCEMRWNESAGKLEERRNFRGE